jgi:hypothetical protein
MLPSSFQGNTLAHDPDVHPLKSAFSKYIKHFIYEWEQDLAAGRNTGKWEREAKQATGERVAGTYDAWKEQEREEHWGQKYDPEHFKTHLSDPTNPQNGVGVISVAMNKEESVACAHKAQTDV